MSGIVESESAHDGNSIAGIEGVGGRGDDESVRRRTGR